MCVTVWSHYGCFLFSLLHYLLNPLHPSSSPMFTSEHGMSYLQCDGGDIAGWGIITRAIKERFTDRPVSGVSTAGPPTLQHRSALGHQQKAQNQRPVRNAPAYAPSWELLGELAASGLWSVSQRTETGVRFIAEVRLSGKMSNEVATGNSLDYRKQLVDLDPSFWKGMHEVVRKCIQTPKIFILMWKTDTKYINVTWKEKEMYKYTTKKSQID